MGATPAVDVLEQSGIKFHLHEYELDPHSTSFGRGAAEALALDPDRVFKTLVVSADGVLSVAVIPVSSELDLKATAHALGAKKVVMADPVLAERSTGYVLGGISPLGQRRRLATVIDASAATWETVFVSAGRRGLELELAPGDLAELSGARLEHVMRSGHGPA